jgi:hypothetical protein
MLNQKRLPPRLIGCLAPRLVAGPGTTLSLSSDSPELKGACFAFFLAGGLAGRGEESDAAVFFVGFWGSFDNSKLGVEWSASFLPMGNGERRGLDTLVGVTGFFNIRCSSSEFSVAELSSGLVLDGPAAAGVSPDLCSNFAPEDPSQSEI